MKFKILFNYIRGYVKVEIQGYFIERLMNLCKKKSIILWGSNRKKASLLYVNVGIRDFRKLIDIAKETKCKVKIKQKKGFPFLCNKYKKRKIFFIFLFLVIVLIITLSNFIWNIEIEGNKNVSEEEIVRFLNKEGLSIGKLKSSINEKEIINKIRLERNDIAWIGIEIKGTNAKIKIVESKPKPEIIDEKDYCNIVATKTGVVTKINAINGVPVVKEGEVVKQGDILIGGWLEGKYTGVRYVHANGQVQAKVWYEKKIKQDLKQVKLSKTGNSENKYSVKINNFEINFYKTLSKFKKYDTIEKKQKLKLFFNFYLPIEIIKKTNNELVEEEVQYGKEEAKQIAVEEAKKMLDQEIEKRDNLVKTYINYTETEQYIEAQVIYEMIEEIGTKEKIVF